MPANCFEHGVKANGSSKKKRATDLHRAASKGDKAAIKRLVKHGANVNARDYSGSTPLHHAISNSHAQDAIKALVACKADVNAANYLGRTPLHLAAKSGKSMAIGQLIKDGAVVDANINVGQTPLHLAAKSGHSEAIDQLIDSGALVNASTGRRGTYSSCRNPLKEVSTRSMDAIGMNTPLHYAAHEGHVKAVQHLLDRGASNRIRNQTGKNTT